jgi:uncharacterized membrane protein
MKTTLTPLHSSMASSTRMQHTTQKTALSAIGQLLLIITVVLMVLGNMESIQRTARHLYETSISTICNTETKFAHAVYADGFWEPANWAK